MDAGNSPHTLTERTFMQIYYWLYKIPCLRNQLQSLWAWIAGLNLKTYNVTDLIPEKEHLRSYLRLASSAVGPRKGIEGANNSCYLDAFLFSMFYTTRIFDFLLTSKPTDTKLKKERRKLLRVGIVKPLREKFFCKFQRVWNLREHLSPINGDLLGAFMDAEQVLYILCKSALEEPHFINYDVTEGSDWGDYMFLMTPDLSDASRISAAQHILEFSFAFNGDIRMASVPNPALILGMPRSDRVLIHYDAVIPNPQLNIEHLLKPEKCQFCENGMEAKWEIQGRRGSDEIPAPAFICKTCISTGQVVTSATHLQGKIVVSRKEMKLNAIICIRGCHFFAFVLAGSTKADNANQKNAWYFFDSMAGGYPEVKIVPGMNQWLVELASDPVKYHTKEIPSLVKRSLTDGHLCIYEPVLWS